MSCDDGYEKSESRDDLTPRRESAVRLSLQRHHGERGAKWQAITVCVLSINTLNRDQTRSAEHHITRAVNELLMSAQQTRDTPANGQACK